MNIIFLILIFSLVSCDLAKKVETEAETEALTIMDKAIHEELDELKKDE